MNTILRLSLLICATLAFTSAYPAVEDEAAPAQPEAVAVEAEESLESAESHHHGGFRRGSWGHGGGWGGGSGWGGRGGGWGRGSGWGGRGGGWGYGGGYGGGYGAGYGWGR